VDYSSSLTKTPSPSPVATVVVVAVAAADDTGSDTALHDNQREWAHCCWM
jgi:hypothetical protein